MDRSAHGCSAHRGTGLPHLVTAVRIFSSVRSGSIDVDFALRSVHNLDVGLDIEM
jgi:hypothetical protein